MGVVIRGYKGITAFGTGSDRLLASAGRAHVDRFISVCMAGCVAFKSAVVADRVSAIGVGVGIVIRGYIGIIAYRTCPDILFARTGCGYIDPFVRVCMAKRSPGMTTPCSVA